MLKNVIRNKRPLTRLQKEVLSGCIFNQGVYVVPDGLYRRIGKERQVVMNVIVCLRDRGYTIVYERQAGSYIDDKSHLTRLQQKTLNTCSFDNGVYEIPGNLQEMIEVEQCRLSGAFRTLKKHGYVFIYKDRYGGQVGTHIKDRLPLTKLQQEILNASIYKDGECIVPANLPDKLKRCRASVKDAVRTLQNKGYKIERSLTKMQQEILDKSIFKNGKYLIPADIHKQFEKGAGPTYSAIRGLQNKGLKIEREITELQKKILKECPCKDGVYRIIPLLYEKLGVVSGRVSEAIKDLRKRGYVFIKEGQVGSYIKDRSAMTDLQRKIIEESIFENGECIIPENLDKKLKKDASHISKAIKTLKKKDFVIFREGQVGGLSQIQRDFLKQCVYKKGIYWVPRGIFKKLGRHSSGLTKTRKILEKKGYKFDRGLTKLQRKIILKCSYKDGIYEIPADLHRKINEDQRSVSISINTLRGKGFVFQLPPLPPKLKEILESRIGVGKPFILRSLSSTSKSLSDKEIERTKEYLARLFKQGNSEAGKELSKLMHGTKEEQKKIIEKCLYSTPEKI